MISVLLAAVLAALWLAIYLSVQGRPVAQPDPCGPVSASDQRSVLWLTQLRQHDKMPLSQIALRPCDSGSRSGAMAVVDVGGSGTVEDFFNTSKGCNVKESCWITSDAGTFLVRLSFVTSTGWQLIVRPQEAG
jgi:hypothetical protein